MKRELIHVGLDDPKYGGGQFIGKLYTEGLGRMPDPAGYRRCQELILDELCSKETLAKIARELFTGAEYAALKLCEKRQAITLFRAILNRDPSYEEILATAEAIGADGLAKVSDALFETDEFAALLPDIVRGPYYFGGANHGYSLSGKVYTAEELMAMLKAAEREVVLEPGDLVLANVPIMIPKGKKLSTRGGYGAHYLKMARIIRTGMYNKGVVNMLDDSVCEGVWVDGNRPEFGERCLKIRRGVCIGADGDGSQICGNRLTDSIGGTSLEVYSVRNTTIRDNLITCYASKHFDGFWCDGATIHGTGTLIERNGIIDATDVSVVIFYFKPGDPQNSVCRDNTFINVGNSGFGGINADGWLNYDHDWDFTGCEFTNNVFWTSYKAHQHICLSFATFAWMRETGNFCLNAKMNGNTTPDGLFVLTGAGIAVDGQKGCEVRDNAIDVYLGPWTNPEIGLVEPQAICMNLKTSTGSVQGPINDVPMFVKDKGFIHGPWHEPFSDVVLEKVSIGK
ncbi:MAG: right-handed parallel beta-helix repeat-containing protein [Clostridiales bacterium]|jgi:hypothetical protein|nr:right-handed parallel beta-helix repeat-containing protein [Clostridiales bacterium]